MRGRAHRGMSARQFFYGFYGGSGFHGNVAREERAQEAEAWRQFVDYSKPIPCRCDHPEHDGPCKEPMCPCQLYRPKCPF